MPESEEVDEMVQRIGKLLTLLAKRGAERSKGKHGKMCNGCAFKEGTEANNDQIVFTAADCISGCPHLFHCHEHEDQKCVGYLYALEQKSKTNE